MAPLPAPVTATDEYLAAVHAELVGLRADLAALSQGGEPAQPDDGRVELVEPKPSPTARRRTRTPSS